MCVGLSAKVVRISDGTAVVDAGGAKREVSSELLEDLEPGDYVMVHAGIAIAKITDEGTCSRCEGHLGACDPCFIAERRKGEHFWSRKRKIYHSSR